MAIDGIDGIGAFEFILTETIDENLAQWSGRVKKVRQIFAAN
jgi:hypothetical protein